MSRNLDDLLPSTKTKFLAFQADFNKTYASQGAELSESCTLRTPEEQNGLYAIGRSVMGSPCKCLMKKVTGKCSKHPFGLPVTNAKAWESEHQYKIAIDMLIIVHGKVTWDDAWYTKAGQMAEKHGFRWSGRWTGSLRETAHIGDADYKMDIPDKKAIPVKH